MSEWKKVRLGDVCKSVISGGTPKSTMPEYYEGGSIPWLNTKEVNFNRIYSTEKCITSNGLKNSAAKWIEQNSIIVAMYGATAGKVAISKIPLTTNQACCNLTIDDNLADYGFVYYYILNNYTQLASLANGGAQQNLNSNHIKDFPIPLPPINEQKRIAGILGALDDKIDLLGRQNATLEAIAETLFRQYFIVSPKEDWKDGRLGDLISINSGFAYKGEYIGRGDSLLLGMGCVSYKYRFLYNGARPYAGDCPNSFMANGGDVVVATRQQSDNMPILGAPAIIPNDLNDNNIIVGTNLYRVKNKSSLSNYCIYLLMRSDDYRNHIDACSKGSTVKMITKDAIESFPMMIPSYDYIIKHQDYFSVIDEKLINNSSQIRCLTKLRDTLLPKLMNNEI